MSEKSTTMVHIVPQKHGLIIYKGLLQLQDVANRLYNQALAAKDEPLAAAANQLYVDATQCLHAQFGNYPIDTLSTPLLKYKNLQV